MRVVKRAFSDIVSQCASKDARTIRLDVHLAGPCPVKRVLENAEQFAVRLAA